MELTDEQTPVDEHGVEQNHSLASAENESQFCLRVLHLAYQRPSEFSKRLGQTTSGMAPAPSFLDSYWGTMLV